ncbi:MAG: pyridoxal phosphate-dependent aminotransferase [Deltaproteobacteria bacterium]|nr:pyridoxal phosphate-dependent aminotransferase [Deltaproteobacteria bacterium]
MDDSTSHDPFEVFRPVPRTGVIYVMHEAMARGFHYGHPGWANLGQGAPETGALPDAAPRVERIELDTAMHEYGPVVGTTELREAVAALYNARYRRGMPSQYTAENVAISAGGRTGLTRLAAALGPVHLGHLLPDYTAYEELLEIFKAFVPIPIALHRSEGFALSPGRLREEILGKGLSALLLSNPCNPTGQAIRGGALASWVEICRELGCWLILDEFYAHYLYGDAAAQDGPSLSACRYVEDVNRDPVVVVDGLTKNWRYPGWRLSWTVGPRSVIERVASAGSFLDGGAPHPIQCAALPLLTQEVADREARAIQAAFATKRRVMLSRLSEMGLSTPAEPQGAFYVFAALDALPPSLRDGMAFFRAALEQQVICVPGAFFDVNPGQRRSHIPSRMTRFVRLSFGPDLQQVESGLDRIGEMIRAA